MSYGSAPSIYNEYKDILADFRYDCPEPKSSRLGNITEKYMEEVALHMELLYPVAS
jgi:hypothetical protein